jgi:hypothetical protein
LLSRDDAMKLPRYHARAGLDVLLAIGVATCLVALLAVSRTRAPLMLGYVQPGPLAPWVLRTAHVDAGLFTTVLCVALFCCSFLGSTNTARTAAAWSAVLLWYAAGIVFVSLLE